MQAAGEAKVETFGESLRSDLRQAFRSPYETPSTIVMNAALVFVCWWLIPHAWFTDLDGEFALPLLLTAWMYADVMATNMLGADADRARAALADPTRLTHFLRSKSLVIWCLATPIAVITTLAVAASNGDWSRGLVTLLALVVTPIALLGLAPMLGIRYPYHPKPFAWRWEHRHERPAFTRWLTLILLPFMGIPTLTAILLVPTMVLWGYWARNGLSGPLTVGELTVGVAVSIVVSVAVGRVSRVSSVKLAMRRREQLDRYLADPDRG